MNARDRTQKIFIYILGVTLLTLVGLWIIGSGDPPESTPTPSNVATSPPVGAIHVSISSSDTKDEWLEQVMEKFNSEEHKTAAGNPIRVSAEHVRSGPSKDAILDGTSMPVVWSPGDSSWVEQLNNTWQERYNKSINNQACRPTVNAPVGFAMWRPMAEALGWPDEPIGWNTIVDLADDPQGWASYGHPEWGRFSFGHAHTAFSNTGLLSMTSFVYGALGNPESLTASQVYEAEEAMHALEQVTSKYGRSSRALLELMAREGPGYLHAAAVPEANVARFNLERGDELHFPLAFVLSYRRAAPSGPTTLTAFWITSNGSLQKWPKPRQPFAITSWLKSSRL